MADFSHYLINGQRYDRVTHILSVTKPVHVKNVLANWKERVGEEEARRISLSSTTNGTAVHKWAEDYCNGVEPTFDREEALPFWDKLAPVLDEITEVRYQETKIYHPIGYAGTLDCYGTFRGIENTLIDFKTSLKPKKFDWIEDYCLQQVAYAAGVKHCFGHGTEQTCTIIALPNKKPQVFILNKDEMFYYWDLWLERLKQFKEITN